MEDVEDIKKYLIRLHEAIQSEATSRIEDFNIAIGETSDHGALSGLPDNDHTQYILHSLAGAANDFLVASGANTYVKKTLAETGAILETDINHDNLVGFVGAEHYDWTDETHDISTTGSVTTTDLITKSPWVDVRAHGATGDGSTDDTTAIQAAITACASGGVVYFPVGDYKITTVLTIANIMTLEGADRSNTQIHTYGCDGIDITAHQVCLRNLMVWCKSGTTHTGIHIKGTHGSVLSNHSMEDVWIYAFNVGAQLDYTWSNTWNKVRISEGTSGLYLFGQSVNNHFNTCEFYGDATSPAANTYAVKLAYNSDEGSSNEPEGNTFGSCLIYAAESTIVMDAAPWSFFENCVIDGATKYGVHVSGGMSGLSLVGNYINISGNEDGSGVLADNSSGLAVGGKIIGNYFIASNTGNTTQGIKLGTLNSLVSIVGNHFRNFTESDIELSGTYCTVTGNTHLTDSQTNNNIYIIGANNVVMGNATQSGVKRAANLFDIASAGTITLPNSGGSYFNITGTTNVTSVTASWEGREATLKFAGILTFTDGSNLKLAGNFVTTADDTITLVCDGTNWYEKSRSVN